MNEFAKAAKQHKNHQDSLKLTKALRQVSKPKYFRTENPDRSVAGLEKVYDAVGELNGSGMVRTSFYGESGDPILVGVDLGDEAPKTYESPEDTNDGIISSDSGDESAADDVINFGMGCIRSFRSGFDDVRKAQIAISANARARMVNLCKENGVDNDQPIAPDNTNQAPGVSERDFFLAAFAVEDDI